jgi:4-amino-4-deoxy-L-arabinose transferase-like glycosyltransferase
MNAIQGPVGHSANLHRRDYLHLAVFAILLFATVLVSGKPLTMHEARLPQTSWEMMVNGEWLLPHSGERPWLERPPFPQWVTIAVGHVFGGLDREWIVRIPPVLMSALILLLVAWMATRLFGREIGVLSPLLVATMYEFYFYSGQAEDDIFLAALVAVCFALFVATEFPVGGSETDCRTRFLGNRPWTVWAFFGALGLTSLAKGPLMGAVQVSAATGAFLLLTGERQRIFRYMWLWGWLVFTALTLAWPILAYRAYPSVWDNWMYDYFGPFGNKPIWYYATALLWAEVPWTPMALLGLWKTREQAWRKRSREYRFLWCWTLMPVVAMSMLSRKHHHYLVPVLAGWGVLAGFGILELRKRLFNGRAQLAATKWVALLVGMIGLLALSIATRWGKIPGPQWMIVTLGAVWLASVSMVFTGLVRQNGRLILAAILAGVLALAAWGQSVLAIARGRGMEDITFLRQVQGLVPADKPLMIVVSDTMEFFRNQFYSRRDAVLLHNITYLRDERIHAAEVYVISRYRDRHFLGGELGTYEVITRSTRSSGERSPEDRWTLFRLHFRPDIVRYPAPKVSVLQAMGRASGDQAGPYCGPPPPSLFDESMQRSP